MRDVVTFSGPFWIGEDGSVICIISGRYLLLENGNKDRTDMGYDLIGVKERLKAMGKDKNFPNFINQ